MKKILLCILSIILLTGCGEKEKEPEEERAALIPKSSTIQVSDDAKSFMVKNLISIDIYEMYICPFGSVTYSDDILGKSILPQNETAQVYYIPSKDCELWDVKILAEDGNYYIWHEVTLGTPGIIELYINDGNTTYSLKE